MDGRDQLLQQLHFVRAFCEPRSDLAQLLRLRDVHGRLPIHLASKYCSVEVIEYLIHKDPEGLSIPDHHGRLASMFALANSNHAIPLQLLKQMFQKHPNDADWGNAWGVALLTQQPVSVLEYMVEVFPRVYTKKHRLVFSVTAFPFAFHQRRPQPFGLEQAQQLTKVLKTFDGLVLSPPGGWDPKAFIHIMEYLAHNQSKARLESITLPSLSIELQNGMLDAFQSMLRNNCRLTHLDVDSQDVDSTLTWYKAIHCGVEARMLDNALSLNVVTSWDNANNIYGGHPVADLEILTNGRGGAGCTQSLSLEIFDYRNELCWKHLSNVPMLLSNLVQLEVYGVHEAHNSGVEIVSEISRCLADLLTSTPTLKILTVTDVAMDPLPVLEVLKTHSSLQRFELRLDSEEAQPLWDREDLVAECVSMLEETNMTLQGCHPWSKANDRIAYLLLLNRCGRAQAKNAKTAPALLDSVLSCGEFCRKSPKEWGLSVWYDFFCEQPGLWCHVAVQNIREGGPSFREAISTGRKTRKANREASRGVIDISCSCWP